MTTTWSAALRFPDFRTGRRWFVLPQWRLAYLSVPKNACTSLKWLMAELAGEDLAGIRRGGLGHNPTPESQIHHRHRWKLTPTPAQLGADVLDSIDPDAGWFVFAVVRDPRLRLFSAWQDKWLLGLTQEPALPGSAEEVVAAWQEFVHDMAIDPTHPARTNGHFRSQVFALKPYRLPPVELYDMTRLGELSGDLDRHLKELGHPGGVVLGRSNQSPFRAVSELFTPDVDAAVRKIYHKDFDLYGSLWPDDVVTKGGAWTQDAFAHARSVLTMEQRVRDLSAAAGRLQARNQRLRRRLARLTHEPPPPADARKGSQFQLPRMLRRST